MGCGGYENKLIETCAALGTCVYIKMVLKSRYL